MKSPDSNFAASASLRYWLLVGCAACQLSTVLITWPVWELRESPPHLPIWGSIPIPFGLFMVLSLSIVAIRPRVGLFVHLAVYLAACFVDQFRTQPQFMALILLMFAVTFEPMGRITRWWLASLWLWAGLHKLLSPHWWGPASSLILSRMDVDSSSLQPLFVVGVAASEIGLGLLALFRPKWAAIGCPVLHGGIVLFLSPLGISWNYSVIPWNLATAVIGYWLLQQSWVIDDRRRWELGCAAAMLIAPAGFYLSLIDHGIASVLYSDYLPRAVVTKDSGDINVTGWGKLHVPFPNERRLYRVYFAQVAEPGDKMHIFDPRPWLEDVYLIMNDHKQPVEISRDRFFRSRANEVAGVAVDDPMAVYRLKEAEAILLKRSEESPVYAVRFSAESFEREQIALLQGLQNLEEIQFSGTAVTDDDLSNLVNLPRLRGIGLNHTQISDVGLRNLKDCPALIVVEARDSAVTPEGAKEAGFEVILE